MTNIEQRTYEMVCSACREIVHHLSEKRTKVKTIVCEYNESNKVLEEFQMDHTIVDINTIKVNSDSVMFTITYRNRKS